MSCSTVSIGSSAIGEAICKASMPAAVIDRNKEINVEISHAQSQQQVMDIWNRSKHEFNPSNYATLLNNLMQKKKLRKIAKEQVLDLVRELMKKGFKEFTPQALATVSYDLTQMHIANEKIFLLIEQEFLQRELVSFNKKLLIFLTAAFARVGIWNERMFDTLEKGLQKVPIKKFEEEELSLIAWSLAFVGRVNSPLFLQVFKERQERYEEGACISQKEQKQLSQVRLALRYEAALDHAQIKWNPHLEKEIDEYLQKPVGERAAKKTLQGQEQLAAALSKCILVSKREYRVCEEGIKIDVLFRKERIAVQYPGPSRYLQEKSALDGEARFKHRILEKMGYRVRVVPYHEWNRCKTESERIKILSKVLISAKV